MGWQLKAQLILTTRDSHSIYLHDIGMIGLSKFIRNHKILPIPTLSIEPDSWNYVNFLQTELVLQSINSLLSRTGGALPPPDGFPSRFVVPNIGQRSTM